MYFLIEESGLYNAKATKVVDVYSMHVFAKK